LFSYGLGLSVVVQLLDEIGGKLEVMSKPGVGSTFRAHFPVEPSKTSASGGLYASDRSRSSGIGQPRGFPTWNAGGVRWVVELHSDSRRCLDASDQA
jgi:hypothetical protein